RRSVLGIAVRMPTYPLSFMADHDVGLRVRFHHAPLAIEQIVPGTFRPDETILVPLDALADVEGRDDSPVVFEATASGTTVVRWEDRAIPQTRSYPVPQPDRLVAFPAWPATFETAPAGLLDALAEAAKIATEGNSRYDLSCIQLRGATGEVVATDG